MSDNPSFEVESPDHFTTGAIGPAGQRVFYLQSRERGQVITLKVEKEHVRALAEYLTGLLARVKGAPGAAAGDRELLEPVEAAWNVGSLAVGYDEGQDRVLVEASELQEEESPEQQEMHERFAHRAPQKRTQPASSRIGLRGVGRGNQLVFAFGRVRRLVGEGTIS